jgi:hypothetical protein
MFGLFTKRCQTCRKAVEGRRYKWHIAGRKLLVCARCNAQLESHARALRSGRGGPPPPETFWEKRSGAIKNLLIAGLGVAVAIAIAYWRPNAQLQEAAEIADAALEKALKKALRVPVPKESAAVDEGKPAVVEDDMIILESTDGRTIRAQILTLSERDVFVRRDDKHEVRIPLNQLTEESRRKVETFRTSLSGNVQ